MSTQSTMYLHAAHIIGIVLWMGTLLTVSRLLGYHAQEAPDTVQPRFSHVERRMYWFVALPGLLITVGAGLGLLLPDRMWKIYLRQPWMHAKLTLVFIVLVLHVVLGFFIADLARKPGIRSRAKYMAVHGTIGLCIVLTVILGAAKPFTR